MSRLFLAVTALALFGPPQLAYAQEGGPYVGAAIARRDAKVHVAGVLSGSLAPAMAFDRSGRMDRAVLGVNAGYLWTFGDSGFIGADLNLDLASSSAVPDSVVSSGTATTLIQVCFPNPPFSPPSPPCSMFNILPESFSESQALQVRLEEGPSAALTFRAGHDWGSTRVGIGGGIAVSAMRLSYDLAALSTIAPPPPLVIIGVPGQTLPSITQVEFAAEKRDTDRLLLGWTANASIEHQISDGVVAGLSYEYADYGAARLADAGRVTNLRMTAIAQTTRVSLRVAF